MWTTLYALLLILPAFASDKIYLKGADGEKLVSDADLTCVSVLKGGGTLLSVTFKLSEQAHEKMKKFLVENQGTKANLMFCGKPLVTPPISEGQTIESTGVPVPPEHQRCVRRIAKKKMKC